MPSALLSYSWDNDAHKQWVRDLAARLRDDGIESLLDQWHLVPGDQLPSFMEKSIRESDHVLVVCTPRYKLRSDNRSGGVGYEGDIMTAELLTAGNSRKFIPLHRAGSWEEAAPSWLLGKFYLDFRKTPPDSPPYLDLLATILGRREQAPPVRLATSPASAATASLPTTRTGAPPASAAADPIKIVGIAVDEVGTPRGDGTRGSALYRVPFVLSRRPSAGWGQIFEDAWNHPTSYTSMHRPGIASVHGDRIVLDGTTVDEVASYHRATLLQAVDRTNETVAELERRRQLDDQRERERLEKHRSEVSEAAKKITFD